MIGERVKSWISYWLKTTCVTSQGLGKVLKIHAYYWSINQYPVIWLVDIQRIQASKKCAKLSGHFLRIEGAFTLWLVALTAK